MRFASCRFLKDKVLFCSFEKEYNKVEFEDMLVLDMEAAVEKIREYDYLDLVVGAKDILYYSRNYPPVKASYLKKIVAQDLETDTPFKENELIVDVNKFQDHEETKVFCIRKDSVEELLGKFDDMSREKFRSIIPENILFFDPQENYEKSIFIGTDYSVIVNDSGQIARTEGLDKVFDQIRDVLGDDSDEELNKWIRASGDISKSSNLSDIEIRISKIIRNFFTEIMGIFAPYAGKPGKTVIFVDSPMPFGTNKIVEALDGSAFSEEPLIYVGAEEALIQISSIADNVPDINFAVGEYAYRGGFSFLKKRIILAAVFYLIALVLLVAGMQVRKGYLDERIERGQEKTAKVMKEVLGKSYPSARQALSIMKKTIRGETAGIDKKSVYPYSALFIMERVFPHAVFEGSTVEIGDLSVKEEGKISLSGLSDTLEDINKLTENLEKDELIYNLNRGQINSRGSKNSFKISFSFGESSKRETGKKAKKGKKKAKSEGDKS